MYRSSQTVSVSTWDGQQFEDLKLPYMAALDDRPYDETAVSIAIERALGAEVDTVMDAHATGTLATENVRARAGLVLIYNALLLQRNSAHVLRGKIDRAALPATPQRGAAALSSCSSWRDAAAPYGRIASWLAATGIADLAPDAR